MIPGARLGERGVKRVLMIATAAALAVHAGEGGVGHAAADRDAAPAAQSGDPPAVTARTDRRPPDGAAGP